MVCSGLREWWRGSSEIPVLGLEVRSRRFPPKHAGVNPWTACESAEAAVRLMRLVCSGPTRRVLLARDHRERPAMMTRTMSEVVAWACSLVQLVNLSVLRCHSPRPLLAPAPDLLDPQKSVTFGNSHTRIVLVHQCQCPSGLQNEQQKQLFPLTEPCSLAHVSRVLSMQ